MKTLLLNTTICSGLPVAGEPDALYRVSAPVSAEEARAALEGVETDSAIGHDATAAALAVLLDRDVPVNRQYARQGIGQRALVLKIRGRLPEGQILDAEALAAVGYDLLWMTREA